MKSQGKVFVGISGGVDSSVSAALLKQAGYNVTGVFIKVWQPDWLECTWREERRDAMRVAAHLDIPFVTLDLEKEYKKEVVDYMIEEYKAGRTPNPDVMCNKFVKFGGIYDWAMKQGADFVATGHYARVRVIPAKAGIQDYVPNPNLSRNTLDSRFRGNDTNEKGFLLTGKDPNKDQSYFLWTLTKQQLPHIFFPIGHLTKPEVRKLATKFKLPTAEKKDSQGLCFIGMVDMKEFLSHYIDKKDGKVLDMQGNVTGRHEGAFLFTIGERHGFIIDKKTPNDAPLFVVSKNIAENTITVSEKTTEGDLPLAKSKVILREINWNQDDIKIGVKLSARSRYREDLQEIILVDKNTVEFTHPQSTLSSGQSLVIYDGDICLGGGVIE